jgi:hypothetical protein
VKSTCVTCREEKDVSDFRKDRTRSDGYQSYCKLCARARHKSAYVNTYRDKIRSRDDAIRQANIAHITEYKQNHLCVKCGETEPICLDFHHIDDNTKEFALSSGKQRSWEKISDELRKCVVLCSNCHRKLHAGLIEL